MGYELYRSFPRDKCCLYLSVACSSFLRHSSACILVLIAFRLIQSYRSVAPYSQSKRLISTLIIIVESAAIYSSALTALVTLYLLGSNGQYVTLDMTAPIIVSFISF